MALTSIQPFICGGMSACLASSIVHPIDLSKTRLQLYTTLHPNAPRPTFIKMLTSMVKENGFRSIYAGLSAALMRQAVYGTARIGLHRTFSDELTRRNGGHSLSFASKALSGMASGSIAVCIGTPFDVTLVRMQADSMKKLADRRGYKNVFDALGRVAREEGVSKLYSGLFANVLRGMAINVGMLSCFDQAKEVVGFYIDGPHAKKASLNTQLSAAMIAGFTASLFSLPFDLLKSRMQDGAKYSGVFDAFRSILRNEGILSFWTGFAAYWGRTAPHAAIILISTEPFNEAYKTIVLGKGK